MVGIGAIEIDLHIRFLDIAKQKLKSVQATSQEDMLKDIIEFCQIIYLAWREQGQ
jgi:hypothetical protein